MSEQKVDMLGGSRRTPLDSLPLPAPRRAATPPAENPLSAASSSMSLPQVALPAYQRRQPEPRQSRSFASSSRYATLDELYSKHLDALNGEFKLRVERVTPRSVVDEFGMQCAVNGVLGYEMRAISIEEFTRKYGGRRYRVTLLSPHPEKTMPDGSPAWSDLGTVEFNVPGEPNLQVLPLAPGADPLTGEIMNPYGRRLQQHQAPSAPQGDGGAGVVTAALDFATRNASSGGPSGDALQAVAQSSLGALQITRDMSQQQFQALERQNQMLAEQLDRARHAQLEANRQPTDLVQMVQAVATLNDASRTKVSSQEIATLERQHREEKEAIERRHREEIDRLRSQHAEEKEAISRRSADEVRRAEDRMRDQQASFSQEREMLKTDADKRERNAKSEAEARLNMIKDQYDNRIKEIMAVNEDRLRIMEKGYERDIKQQQENHDRELRTIERTHKLTSETGNQSVELKIGVIQQQLLQKEQELQTVKLENSQLRDKYLNKTPLEAIQEATGVVSALQSHFGGGDKEEAEEKKTLAERAIDGLAQNAPAMLGFLGGLINRPAQPQQMQQLPPSPHIPPHQLPPGQPPRQPQPRRQPPKMVWADDDGAPVRVDEPPPPPPRAARVSNRTPDHIRASAPGAPRQAPPRQESTPAAEQIQIPQMETVEIPEPMVANPEPIPEPTPDPQDLATNRWEGLEWTGLPDSTLVELFSALEQDCSSKTPPEQAVDHLIQKYSAPVMQVAAARIDVDRMCDGIKQARVTSETVLATAKGQKWIRKVWASLGKKLGAEQ